MQGYSRRPKDQIILSILFILNILDKQYWIEWIYLHSFFGFGKNERLHFEQYGMNANDCTLRVAFDSSDIESAKLVQKRITDFPEKGNDALGCYSMRVISGQTDLFDWQVIPDEKMDQIISGCVQDRILPIFHTELEELGKQDWICKRCACSRMKCPIAG